MILRKLVAALFSSIILTVVWFILGFLDSGEGMWWLLLVLFFSLVGNYFYGVPVSFLSELLTTRLVKTRIYAIGFLYMFFAYITVYIVEGLVFFAIICALLFFFIDEGIKVVKDTANGMHKKTHFLKLLSILPFAALAAWGGYHQMNIDLKETNNLYVIPEGYEGSVVVFHNMPDEPKVNKEEEFSVIPLSIESLPTLMGSDIERYATYRTSSEGAITGRITDQFHSVDNQGNRTEIESSCIHYGPVASSNGEPDYQVFQVTNTSCGQDFQISGNERYDAQTMEILKYWGYY